MTTITDESGHASQHSGTALRRVTVPRTSARVKQMKRLGLVVMVAALASAADAIPGDLNLDGKVDFDDFFQFADNFGQEGAPETLRVVVMDTTVVEVTVYDTVVVLDTTLVIDPLTSDYDTRLQALERLDLSQPLEGLRHLRSYHSTSSFRLGPGLIRQDHEIFEATYFEDGFQHRKTYLKPSGHLIYHIASPYSVEVLHADGDGGYIEIILSESYSYTSVHNIYDADMAVIESDTTSSVSSSEPRDRWLYMTLRDDGIWDVDASYDELSASYNYELLTVEPLDVAAELTQ